MTRFAILTAILILMLTACSSPATSAATSAPAQSSPVTQSTSDTNSAGGGNSAASAAPTTAAPTTAASPESAPANSGTITSPASGDIIRLEIVSDESEARYLVKEQLADRSLPNDAIGKTKAVSGQITLTPDGEIVSEQSKISVDLSTLQSDSGRRDGFVRMNLLRTNEHPMAEFVPKAVRGLTTPLPSSGPIELQLEGDLTVRGVTKPVTWDVTAEVNGQEVAGTAKTAVTFGDFNMEQPRVAVVLSVEDNIRLEMDFKVRRLG